jgi:hypothetical protein
METGGPLKRRAARGRQGVKVEPPVTGAHDRLIGAQLGAEGLIEHADVGVGLFLQASAIALVVILGHGGGL